MVSTIWQEFLHIIEQEAGSRIVETWFKAVTLKQWDPHNATAYLEAPNHFIRDWIRNNYQSMITMHLGRLLNVSKVILVFIEPHATPSSTAIVESQTFTPVVSAAATVTKDSVPAKATLVKNRSHINRVFSFETYVVGPSNSLAYAAAQAITERPGSIYNPLFIYGESGLGKTHLLHAIGNEIKQKHKQSVVLYQTADRFVNEFINAIRFDRVSQFQHKYKSVDVLLIDDIQFISNKEQTQEAFFHIFNSLYESHKQIVFSSDTYPQNIQGIAERLSSRLACGLVADIRAPHLETKIAILKRKAELNGEFLSDDVAHFIASRVVSNIRELEGSLIRVMAFASLTGHDVTVELAQKVLHRAPQAKAVRTDLETVVHGMSGYYPYSLNDLRSKSRSKDLSFARQVAMFLMKKVTDKSLRDIGEFLGGRDHSTVMHALSKIDQQCKSDSDFENRIKKMEHDILNSISR